MKQSLLEAYDLKVEDIVSIRSELFLVKTKQENYALKCTKDLNIEKVYQSIVTLRLKYFVSLIKNKQGHYLTSYQDQYYYLMEWVEADSILLKELKLKFYFEMLVYLHEKTFYHIQKSEANIDQLCLDISHVIDQRSRFYETLMSKSEVNPYRSPSEWMLLLNYYRYYESLEKAKTYLDRYQSLLKDRKQIRVCFVYMNFDFDHLCLNQQKVLSIDKMMIHIPIYDLFYLFQQIQNGLFDLESLSYHYLNHIQLLEEEKVLLCCLLSIVPYIYFSDNQIDNVIRLSRLNYYLEASKHLISMILDDNNH